MDKLLIVRRSIYDKNVTTQGYELVFRVPRLGINDANALTHAYLTQLFSDKKMKPLMGAGLIWITFSSAMFHEAVPDCLPKKNLVIVINGEHMTLDDKLLTQLNELKKQGFQLACCGFNTKKTLEPLLKQVDFIRLNASVLTEKKLETLAKDLTDQGPSLIIDNVQTHELFEETKKMGFHYFMGYFLELPNLDTGQKVSTNRTVTLQLLSNLNDPKITIEKVEKLVSQDPRLSYRLLKTVNASSFGFSRKIHSLHEAIVMIGLKQIKSWVSLVIITCQEEKPAELLINTMARAKMCELAGEHIGTEDPKLFFTAGLLSTLDAILDQPLKTLLNDLVLDEILEKALLNQIGDAGAILKNVIAYHRSDWDELKDSGIETDTWRSLYEESTEWASTAFQELNM